MLYLLELRWGLETTVAALVLAVTATAELRKRLWGVTEGGFRSRVLFYVLQYYLPVT